ncbi:centrosomal protein of 85 kDa isoform X1 [Sphaerodactylus townsendi]|uniref:centrosomal protein of 85 kDa isoform X1 n=2 Tax=Sphaerodactylus townsendi TaxID=933632 RepID=UPI0020261CE9|nr:centrosomal protein of 85 kDa isoform X1 [Sphaerodactylus townsendi]XP_048357065.1 centrosomal protein of 85 kDa isoform X1 [Sphaerodactylus townsendi]XP_048357066.1 centrosomal protein of 85 kDa isoform X1 [Sphaerodactylus townsendi]
MAACGGTLNGTSSSTNAEAFCNSSDGSSFQPIKTQVAIPTAHVMPSMLESPPCKPCTVGKSSTSLAGRTSFLPCPSDDTAGLVTNCKASRHNQAFPRDYLPMYQASLENDFDRSLFPSADQESMQDAQKYGRLAAEYTFNHSAFLESDGPWTQLQICNSIIGPADLEKEPCRVQLSSKPTAEASKICEKQLSLGPNPAMTYSNSVAAQSQVWTQQTCTQHSHDDCVCSAWKQHLDRVRQQLDQIQLQSKAAYYHPLVNSTSLPSVDPTQWVGVVNANENLLREKEILIDRQRQHISQLEQKVQESELQVHSAFFGPPVPYGDIYLLRMQELQQENVFLRAQFTEKTELLSKEKIELERKLAAAEAGEKQIQEFHKKTVQKYEAVLKKQEERVNTRDKHIEHLKKKCQKESEQNREKQQRIETLERYLADLPVLEDHQKQSQQLKEAQQTIAVLQETVTALEKDLNGIRASCREKELQLETQKHKEMELLSTVHSLQDKMQCGKMLSAEGYAQEMEKMKGKKESLQKECDLLRKIVDKQKKKMDQLSSQMKGLEEQLAQEEGTGQALRMEAMRQESALQQLRLAVKELSAQNQELIEKNLTLQEHLRQIEPSQQLPGEMAHLAEELHKELASCLQDLQSVYSVVTQRAQGKDPNLSLLLGIPSVQCSVKEKGDLLKPDMLAKKLDDVRQLHKDIEDLRTTISDRYAQDMGDYCITQ